MMKKSLIAVAILGAFAGSAQAETVLNTAQTQLDVYGTLDLGVVQMTNAGNISPNFVTGATPTGSANAARLGTVRGMINGGESASRWGIKGSEDLGDGNKAFFQLESGFSVANGNLNTSGLAGGTGSTNMIADTSLNGQLFGRAAFIGVSNTDLGALSFGRQNSLQLDVIAAIGGGYDPVNAQMFSPINFSGSYGGGGTTDNARVDNSIKYAKKIGNINVNALYSMGGMANASSARSDAQLNVGYEADTFGVQAAYQQANDTTALSTAAAVTPNTVAAQFMNLTSYMIAGRYQPMDALTLKAGYERMQISAPSNFGVDSKLTTIYSYNISAATAFGAAQKNVDVFWLGANYQVSPAIKASVGFYDAKTPAYGAVLDADDKYYSAMVEYSMSKRTNFYAAVMADKKSGSAVAATGAGSIASFNTYGAGLRIKF